MNTTAAIAGARKPVIRMLLSCWLNYSNKMQEVFLHSQTVHTWFHLLYVVPWNKEGNCQKFSLINCQIQKNPKGERNFQMLQVLIIRVLTRVPVLVQATALHLPCVRACTWGRSSAGIRWHCSSGLCLLAKALVHMTWLKTSRKNYFVPEQTMFLIAN